MYWTLQVEDCAEHRVHITTRQMGQQEFLHQAFAVHLNKPTSQRRAYLVVAVGHEQQEGMSSTVPGKIVEKFQAGIVTPMQVLNNQQKRLFCSQAYEAMCQCGEDATLFLFRLNWRQWLRSIQIRCQGDHFR